MSHLRTLATVLATGGALCASGCGTSVKDYTCRDLTSSAAKREALSDVIVVQVRTKQRAIAAEAVEQLIERRCAGGPAERLRPRAKPYQRLLEDAESRAGV
jgi:hypothetical protein